MPMHEDEYAAQWCEALRCYSYPTVTALLVGQLDHRLDSGVCGHRSY